MRIHVSAAVALVTYSILAVGLFSYNQVFAAQADVCTVRQTSDGWSVDQDNGTITGSFVVSGGLGCSTTDVSVMSWKADPSQLPNDQFWTNQTVNDIQTKNLGMGTHSITVKLPQCSGYQADVIAGANPSPTLKPPGQGSAYDAKQPDGSSIVVASAIGDTQCSTTATATTSTSTDTTKKKKKITPPITNTTTTPSPTHTFTPTTTIIPSTGTPIVLASAAPKPVTLPNTGPGSTLAIFAGVAVAAGLLHYFKFSKRHELEFVPDHGAPVIIAPHHAHPDHQPVHHAPLGHHENPHDHQPPTHPAL
jgi:hypothetical protein